MEIKPIGYIHTKFPDKFGIPRQSMIVDTPGYIELLEPYNDLNATRGLEDFSHLWLIWQASENLDSNGQWEWHPTARPPRLGGNERKGIFATRSPFHPNLIGMSCVKLDRIENGVLHVLGADVVDGTPLLDIKPYIAYSDSIYDARSGYAQAPEVGVLEVVLAEGVEGSIDSDDLRTISQIIAQNPRPHYHEDEDRIYGMRYDSYEIKFSIGDGVATILSIIPLQSQ